ncbi:Xaa-Pro peptidase family protein [Ammoniphilus sp. CFH 90114]|uniref:M24 family metallopeptidase n=1 Tax=Ammoniphilus sp. CFH 90114 TaxID=2493665 RepID=UPI00100EB83B|nr:M24 family metallopeptidase [Ammoniphilus sp. CFH 90114]RXT03747.1 M24 family metallopeptidase [Ammoniphilus sp. CFH 90114]
MVQSRFSKRLGEIREIMRANQVEWLRLTTQKNISWLIAGRTHVNTASELACCNFLISSVDCIFISNNIENERMLQEEILLRDEKDITGNEKWDWFEPAQLARRIEKYAATSRVVMDLELESVLLTLRSCVDVEDLPELRELGTLTTEAMEEAAMAVNKGDSEYQIAGKLAYHCWERELEPIVNLIAVDERAYVRRHPLPTPKRLEQYAMLVVCTRKNGLIASATRSLHFGAIPQELQARHQAAAEIDAKIMHLSRPGITLGSIFNRLKEFYHEAGYPEEFRLHHQGGLTGYATREKLATHGESFVVQANQVYAWNPSIAGAKSEDTLFVGVSENEILTPSKQFPMKEFQLEGLTWRRPAILQRQA